MIDFHCHVDLYQQPDSIAQRIADAHVGAVSVTTTPSAWRGTKALEIGRPTIKTALGFHPELAALRRSELDQFEALLSETEWVGEVGLDGSPNHVAAREVQREVFARILTLCEHSGGKFLTIHSRRAASPVLDLLESHRGAGTPILHWFTGTPAELGRAVELGCWFSVGLGMLAGARGRRLASLMPRGRVVLESDGPFAQVDGEPVGPWDMNRTADALSEAWNQSRAQIFDQIQTNEDGIQHRMAI